MKVALLSTYEMGRQPFGLASPAAWLRAAGHQVAVADLSLDPMPLAGLATADLIAFYLPMHTATRLAFKAIGRVRAINSTAQLCCFGLYAPMNSGWLRAAGVQTILGGEFEQGLVDLANGVTPASEISLARQQFLVPDRTGLPPLARYAKLLGSGEPKQAGYTEASRGCKHLCRHCPIVPVYNGRFRIVQREVVLADIAQQVEAGARHITFGDPDFFNGTGHAVPLVQDFERRFPGITYDVTIKIEHLLKHRDLLPLLKRTGCAFVTSAVESIDDRVLEILDKGHTRADFIQAVALTREAGLPLAPTFVTFTPWTTRESYRDLLRLLVELELARSVAPIQLAIRLLIPAGSRLLELEDVRARIGPFDASSLSYKWEHEDAGMDRLCAEIQDLIKRNGTRPREWIFSRIWSLADGPELPDFHLPDRATVPYLSEPWYC